jgi:cell division septum initiation protein DivIVA
MLEDLEELAVERPRSLGPICFGLNRDEIQMTISKVRASLPGEVKQAQTLTREAERHIEMARDEASKTIESAQREAERLIDEARKEADRLVNEAKLGQERLLAENEILKLAKAQADEIRSTADRDAGAMRRGAEDYAYNVLDQLGNVVTKAMTTIDRGRAEIKPNVIEHGVVPAREREKAKIGS